MNRKVLFLGIDAGNRHLLEQWAAEGVLPNIARLLANGLRGRTSSLPGLYTGATWPSFQTGVNPARSGVYAWMQLAPGSYEPYRCLTGEALRREPFWTWMSRAGRKVTVLDIPLSGLTRDLHGVQLVEWGAHDAQYGFMTWPAALARDVEARFGRHPLREICNADRDTAAFVEFRDHLVRAVATKARMTRHFLRSTQWNFFAQVF